MHVGRKIKQLREKHGLSLKQLGLASSTSEPSLIDIEKGRVATDLNRLEAFARELDVDVVDLMPPKKHAALSDPIREVVAILSALDEAKVRKLAVQIQDMVDGLKRAEASDKVRQGKREAR